MKLIIEDIIYNLDNFLVKEIDIKILKTYYRNNREKIQEELEEYILLKCFKESISLGRKSYETENECLIRNYNNFKNRVYVNTINRTNLINLF